MSRNLITEKTEVSKILEQKTRFVVSRILELEVSVTMSKITGQGISFATVRILRVREEK